MQRKFNITVAFGICIKAVVLLFIFCCVTLPCSSQEKNEWIENADASFKNEDYQNAIKYYLKAIAKEITTDIVKPYELKPYEKPLTASGEPETKKKQKPTIKLNQPAQFQQYVAHQLAESYRFIHDYKNAEVWYKKVLDSKPPLQFPFDHFWYGDALVKNERYKTAIPEFMAVLK
ncbi:MAG TPA: hypothetical protein VFF27_03020, partial [Bacteroidia bacterium]|nr:hypothetical protein [Bacteroidia bacterium]